jgi:hypothetical protein
VAQASWSAVPILAAAVLAATTGAAEERRDPPPAGTAVKWHDPSHALPFDHEALAGEVKALLAPAGLELAWEAAAPDTSDDAGSALRVVLLAAEQAGPSDVMGSVQRGGASRTAWIILRGVERTLGLPAGHAGKPWPPGSHRLLAHALARVIVHELVHLLVPDLPHTRGGLMAPRLGRPFLTAQHVALSPAVAAAVRSAASGDVPAGPRRWASVEP